MSSSNEDEFPNFQEVMLHDRLHLQLLSRGEGIREALIGLGHAQKHTGEIHSFRLELQYIKSDPTFQDLYSNT